MKQLEILRMVEGRTCAFALTDGELEKAYEIKQKEYLEEDFACEMAEAIKDEGTRFHSGHLDEFPELVDWLYEAYEDMFDANVSVNDMIKHVLNKLEDESDKAAFFERLVFLTKVLCRGYQKELRLCERKCSSYYHCANIAEANDRCKKWEDLASLIHMHENGNCECNNKNGKECTAAKYLNRSWDISDFFHSLEGEEK